MREKIEQCRRDIEGLRAEIKHLEGIVTPRHGDIVEPKNEAGRRFIVLIPYIGQYPCAYDEDGKVLDSVPTDYSQGNYTVLGNVFDKGGNIYGNHTENQNRPASQR